MPCLRVIPSMLAACALTCACSTSTTRPPAAAPIAPAQPVASAPVPAEAPPQPVTFAPTEPLPATDIRTRNALFKTARFEQLPGWRDDDLLGAWAALQTSCRALARRDVWQPICRRAERQKRDDRELHRFFETEFALYRILETNATPDGDVTGYYEPLIAGSLRPEGNFRIPVYGRPNDLYTIDWKTVPPSLRRGTFFVVPQGRTLTPMANRRDGAYTLDATRFTLDTRDRVWRLQLVGDRALPYRSRGEIEAARRIDAPVLAYVEDALALYAMQVQGSGRVKLRDGRVLRLQYAEQNGHPFQPLRLASTTPARVLTRGPAGSIDETPESFRLADEDPTRSHDGIDGIANVATRGMKRTLDPSATPAAPVQGTATGAADALVDELLGRAPRRATTTEAAAPSPAAVAEARAAEKAPHVPPGPWSALNADPSYVFFRPAEDQAPDRGPNGALGVPLTAGRSIAVDPRITPLGYPVFISSTEGSGTASTLQKLVIAQDTGGAIRGAVRADLFLGTGAEAGRQALGTRRRGEMWLLLPRAEVHTLQKSSVVTRGVGTAAARLDSECLVDDESFCTEPD